ncbi:hypothetical protein TNCV_1794391 [Trichonephila clavipes]|nr:hypothetical protein TNCV_1794391 [Trichonephila clavipes]
MPISVSNRNLQQLWEPKKNDNTIVSKTFPTVEHYPNIMNHFRVMDHVTIQFDSIGQKFQTEDVLAYTLTNPQRGVREVKTMMISQKDEPRKS